ncbi:hypothetical protein D3C71_935820 [compost metagenome]
MPFAHPFAGLVQAASGGDGEQVADHAHGGDEGNAALQQNAQGSVEACQLIHEDALVHRGEFFDHAVQPSPKRRLALQQDEGDDDGQQATEEFALVGVKEHAAAHQDLRQPRQVRPQPFEHQAETRHDVAHQEQHHTAAHNQQQHGVDRRADDLLANLVHALSITDISAQGIADGTGLLAGLHQRHVQRRENGRQLAQGLGKRFALVKQAHQLAQGFAGLWRVFLFRQAFQRIDQRQAGVEQGGQLLAEQHQVERLALVQAQRAPMSLGVQADHPQALVFGDAPGFAVPRCLDGHRDHTGLADGLEMKAHGRHSRQFQLVTSAFSPSPPGCPSLPMDNRSYSLFSPG